MYEKGVCGTLAGCCEGARAHAIASVCPIARKEHDTVDAPLMRWDPIPAGANHYTDLRVVQLTYRMYYEASSKSFTGRFTSLPVPDAL